MPLGTTRSFTQVLEDILGLEKQPDPVVQEVRDESQRSANTIAAERFPYTFEENPLRAATDAIAGFGKGFLIDNSVGAANIAANAIQATVPFLDLKAMGEGVRDALASPADSSLSAFVDRINTKPTDMSFEFIDILGLRHVNAEMARRLDDAGAPTEIAPIYTLMDVIGVQPAIEFLTGREAITGRPLTAEEGARLLGAAVVPASITLSAATGAVRQITRKTRPSLIDPPMERLVTRADIAHRMGDQAREAGEPVTTALPDQLVTPPDMASALANDSALAIPPERAAQLGEALSEILGPEAPPPDLPGALGFEPEFTNVLTPDSLSEAIFSTHENIVAALRELPQDKQTLRISEQVADVLRSQPGLPEARIVELSHKLGIDREALVDEMMLAQRVIAEQITDSPSTAGGILQKLSEVEELVNALQQTSPDPADRMIALNRRLEQRRGGMAWLNDVVIRPGLASAVSGFGNAMRDMMVQRGVAWTKALEDSMEGVGLFAANSIENFTRRRRGLAERERTPDMAAWSDGFVGLMEFMEYAGDVPGRISARFSDEGMAWSRDAMAADFAGKPRPPLPESLRNDRTHYWNGIMDSVPTESARMLSSQLADINSIGLQAEAFRLFADKLDEAQLPDRQWKAFVDMQRLGADIASNLVTLPRRLMDMEQTKLFFAEKASAWAHRHGIDTTKPDGLKQLHDLMNETQENRPAWLDDMYRDSAQHALESTFRGDPNSSFLRWYVKTHAANPWLNFAGLKFPRFVANKLGFIMDRNPFLVFSAFKPETIRSLYGALDEGVLLEDVIKATPEARKLWDEASTLTDKSLRERAVRDAERITDADVRSKALASASELQATPRIRELKAKAEEIARARPDYDTLHQKAIGKIQQRNVKNVAKGISGLGMLSLAMQLRANGYQGSRYYMLDFGPVDPERPEGERRVVDTRNWAPVADYMGMATVADLVQNGRSPFDEMGLDDMIETITGIRRINEETVLAVGDIVRAMGQGQNNPELAMEALQEIFAGNLGMYTAFFRNLRDVESMNELMSTGERAVLQDPRKENPWLGQAISNLPNAWQAKARELVSGGKQTGPLPEAVNPFDGKPMYASHPGPRLAIGLNVRPETGINRLLNMTGTSRRQMIGRSGSDELDRLVGNHMGQLMGMTMDDNGNTWGDMLTELTMETAKGFADQGYDYRLALRDELLENFKTVRETAKDMAFSDLVEQNPEEAERLLATEGLTASEKEFIERLLEIDKRKKAVAQ